MKRRKLIYLVIALIFTFGQIGYSIAVSAETIGNVNQINAISPSEIQLVGNQLQPENKSIKLTGDNNSSLTATYDNSSKSFKIANGTLTPGVNYKVTADWTNIPSDKGQIAIPIVTSTKQISPNQVQVAYDRDVDIRSASKPSNYWIQSTNEDKPTGIATLGKNDKVNASNALTSDKVDIKPVDGSKKSFILTFRQNITPKMQYRIIVCYVTIPGSIGFTGDNIGPSGNNTFIGQ